MSPVKNRPTEAAAPKASGRSVSSGLNQVTATAKGLRVSPRKLALVAALVKGRSVKDSLIILAHTPKTAAPLLAKVIKSASANAETNQKLPTDQLQLGAIIVNPGYVRKGIHHGARGMIRPLRHRTSQVTVIVEGTKPTVSSASAEQSQPAKVKR